jgi:pantoate--beta-alanine ligase
MLLEPEIRKNASAIYKTISVAALLLKDNEIHETALFVKNEIERLKGFELIYFEIIDDEQLIPIKSKQKINENKKYFGCIAVKAGAIRLIDNIEIDWCE